MKVLGLRDTMPIQGVMNIVTKIERSGVTLVSEAGVETKISLKSMEDFMF
jgi:hypothetical protein